MTTSLLGSSTTQAQVYTMLGSRVYHDRAWDLVICLSQLRLGLRCLRPCSSRLGPKPQCPSLSPRHSHLSLLRSGSGPRSYARVPTAIFLKILYISRNKQSVNTFTVFKVICKPYFDNRTLLKQRSLTSALETFLDRENYP